MGHEDLSQGRPTRLVLRSHSGKSIGKMFAKEKKYGPWRYILSSIVPVDSAVTVKFEDLNFIVLADNDLVLDVAFGVLEIGSSINFVGGTGSQSKTKQSGGGRDWTINQDGTISAKHCPSLVLGIQIPRKEWSSGVIPEHGLTNLEAYGKAMLPVPR